MSRQIPVTQARGELSDLVSRVAFSGERISLTRHGKAVAALVSAADLARLEELDSAADNIDVGVDVDVESGAGSGAGGRFVDVGRPRTDPVERPVPVRRFGIAAEHQPSTHQPSTHQPSTHQPPTHQPPTHQPPTHQPPTHRPPAGGTTG